MKTTNEIWKEIPGYEGFYEVSSLGRVKSLVREIMTPKGIFFKKERLLRQALNWKGYPAVTLSKNNTQKNIKVHQLIAMAFLGHVPNGLKTVIDHINDIKTDNRLENIRLTTNRDNVSKGSKSPLPVGVDKNGKGFMARIWICHKKVHLGTFKTIEEASRAYQQALHNHLSLID